MRASDIQIALQPITRATTALEAARLIAADRLAALVIANEEGTPVAVVSAVDALGLLVPNYIMSDLSLSGVFSETGAEDVWNGTAQRAIAELLDDTGVRKHELLKVDADATLVEIAAQMADERAQIALVRGTEKEPRFVLLPDVMDAIITYCERVPGVGE